MALKITASVDKLEIASLQRKLERASSQIRDTSIPNKRFGTQIYALTLRNFRMEGSVFGRWAPLAASTIAEKQRIGKNVMLVRSGAMRGGFNVEVSRDNVVIGNNVGYSQFFEDGTSKMPQRKLLPPVELFLETAITVYNQYIAQVVERAK